MARGFHPLSVRSIHRETPDAVSVVFDVPEHLTETFRFTQGQYLTLRTQIDGQDLRRSYSICSAPHEGVLRVAVKLLEGGLFSTYVNKRLQPGDVLQVMAPQGRFFTPLDAQNQRLYVAFAAGSGITPILSIIKATLFQEPKSNFILFFGNKGFDHIIFREELEALKNSYPARFSVHHVLSRESLGSPLFQGRLDGDKCRQYVRYIFNPQQVDACFLCGPEEMIFSVKDALVESGMEPSHIHFELFATSAPGMKPVAPASAKTALEASVTVVQDGMTFDFTLPSDGSTLLDAAMRAGADLPFSCKGGVCSTCKAKILEGEASMELNYGLEPDEIAAGYVLTCQAHPKTTRLVVSFDA
ncbi:MAG: phenylacetate-CoA oxygenase/reductase subunit PaaK [Saprospiraceae bacterium]|nr:phenylacetate-CoA oxygenase/reductase subunit PaaK [Saprospiraceae bacterium]